MAQSNTLKTPRTPILSWIWLVCFCLVPPAVVLAFYYGPLAYLAWRLGGEIIWSVPDFPLLFRFITSQALTLQLEVALVFTSILFLGLLFFKSTATTWRRSRQQPVGIEGLHGSAHWATWKEIQQTGLLPADPSKPHLGVYCGAWKDPHRDTVHLLKHSGPEHVLAFAPTRSGKGVGLVLPTLLEGWHDSALVFDPKGEAWALTSGFRQRELGQRVFKFDPSSIEPDVARYNPLAEVRVGESEDVADAQNIAQILVDPDGLGFENNHFKQAAFSLLSALILHVCYVKKNRAEARGETGPLESASLVDVENWFGHPGDSIKAKFKDLLNTPHIDIEGWQELLPHEAKKRKYKAAAFVYGNRIQPEGGLCHPMIRNEAQINMDRSDKELSSVVSTALNQLALYRDPIIAQNVSRSDWKIDDLMNQDQPATAYLVVRPADIERLRPLIRLILTQIVRRLTAAMDYQEGRAVRPYKHQLLLLIDEFTALKRLGVIEDTLPYMASYGIKSFLIVQDLQQLLATYGIQESLVGNCHLRLAFAPNKLETAKLLSEWAGDRTIVQKKFSKSGKRSKLRDDGVSESVTEHRRRLLLPEEVMKLPGAIKDSSGNILSAGDMLIFAAGHSPIYGKQVLYFQDPELLRRANLPPPTVSDTTNPLQLQQREEVKTIEKRERQLEADPVARSPVRAGGRAGVT